jgi:hypothetical protein
VLKHCDHTSGSRGNVLLHSFAFFANDVADAIARVPEQIHAASSAYEG